MFIDEIEDEVTEEEEEAEAEEEEIVAEEKETEVSKESDREVKLEAENKKLKAILERNKNKNQKSGDFGYDVKAYLKSSGISATEFDFVKAEMKSSGMKDVDTLLENPYFQSRLTEYRELSKTQNAVPSGKRSTGVPTDSVEYWLSKPIEEVPMDKRRAVVNAKIEQEANKSKFYNT